MIAYRIFALLLTLLAGVLCPARAQDVVRTQTDARDRMTIPVMIGDKGPFRFMVDTGSQSSVVSDTLAAALQLPPGRPGTLITVAGVHSVATVMLRAVQFGRKRFDQPSAPVLPRGEIGADGIIGLDGLEGERVIFDFEHGAIIVELAAKPSDSGFDVAVRANRHKGELIMTSADVDGVPTAVMIDTGSDATIANRELQRALSHRDKGEPGTLQSVTGQKVDADVSVPHSLAIGRLLLNNVSIAYTDSTVFERLGMKRRPAILIGMRDLLNLKRMAVDFIIGKVLFDLPGT